MTDLSPIDAKRLSIYKRLILTRLATPGKFRAIHIAYGVYNAHFACFNPKQNASKPRDHFWVAEQIPGKKPELFAQAVRELEHEGVLVPYRLFEYVYAGVTLEYIVGLPERESEFARSQLSLTAA